MAFPQQPTPQQPTPQQPGPRPAAPLSHEFSASGPIDLNVQTLRGAITLRAEHGTAVRVQLTPHGDAAQELVERLTVRFEHDRLTVDMPSEGFGAVGGDIGGFFRSFGEQGATGFSDRIAQGMRSLARGAEGLGSRLDIAVMVPTGSRAVISDGAGDVNIHGLLARLEARTGTGDLTLDRGAEEANRLSTGAGTITVGPVAGDLVAKTGTGDLSVAEAQGEVSLTAGVGDVTVRRAISGRLTVRTGLGDVLIQVEPGTATHLDLATGLGSRDVSLTPADGAGEAERTLESEAKSGTGDLRVRRAEPAASTP